MTKGFLITPSLYNSWKFWIDGEGEGKAEILDTLNKVDKPKSEAMLNGIAFENEVLNVCNGGKSDDPCVNEIAGIVKGGLWQQKISRELDGDLVYGVADVIKRNTIYDIKRVNSYEVGKYEYSIQHLIYLYSMQIPNFAYLISDGNNVYEEAYYWEGKSLDTLRIRITDMKDSILADSEMREAFINNWKFRKEENDGNIL
jgi:hypothetical protein